MSRFSVSRINTYLQNPWKHWCRYIAGYKPKYNAEANKYMDRGTVFHRAMELMSQGNPADTAKARAIKEGQEKGFCEEALETGIIAVDRYIELNPDLDLSNVIHTEYKLEFDMGDGLEFIGYIDAIIQHEDGTVTLVDYKTYSTAPKVDNLTYSAQANMYMYVATQLGFDVRDFIFDCINPKAVLKGNMYKNKKIMLSHNLERAEETYQQFVALCKIIEANPDFRMYTVGEYMPDLYDSLYKVYVGDIDVDLDDYVETYFEPFEDDEQFEEGD